MLDSTGLVDSPCSVWLSAVLKIHDEESGYMLYIQGCYHFSRDIMVFFRFLYFLVSFIFLEVTVTTFEAFIENRSIEIWGISFSNYMNCTWQIPSFDGSFFGTFFSAGESRAFVSN